jgi:hypothetical protein
VFFVPIYMLCCTSLTNLIVPNERPPPTEDDPDVEEAAMNAIMDDEAKDLE